MAQTELDTLLIKISADTAALRGEMAKANAAVAKSMVAMQKEAEKVNKTFEKAFGDIKSKIQQAFTVTGAIALARQLVGLVQQVDEMARKTLDWAEAQKGLADDLAVSTDWVQAFDLIARQNGATTEQWSQALIKARKELSEFAAGGKNDVFTRMGMSAREAADLVADFERGLPRLADKLKEFDRPSQITIVESIFGKQSKEILPILEQGGAALAAQVKRAQELGVVNGRLIELGDEYRKKLLEIEQGPLSRMKELTLEASIAWVDINRQATEFGAILAQKVLPILRVLPGFQAPVLTFEARQEAIESERRAREQAAGADAMALPTVPAQKPTGRRLPPAGTGSGGESELEKVLRRITEQAAVTRTALEKGPAAAEWEKFRDDLVRLKASQDQVDKAFITFQETLTTRGQIALKDYAKEVRRLDEITDAEIKGNRELAAVIEARYALEDKLGRALSEVEKQRVDQLSRIKFKIEENRRQSLQMWEEIRSFVGSGLNDLSSALFQFGNTNETVWERIRNTAVRALEQIAAKIFELGVMNQIMNSLFKGTPGYQPLPTLLGIATSLIGGLGGVDASGVGFATGGSFRVGGQGGTDTTPVKFWATPGEEVTIRTPEQVRRGGAHGGGNTIIIDAREASDPAAVEAAAYRAVIKASPHLVNASVNKVRDTAWRDPNYLPR